MSTMEMYCPSLKKKVEATIVDGKYVTSKGGSKRRVLYGEYNGKKCLPKTVKADVFAEYGFSAEESLVGSPSPPSPLDDAPEAVYIKGNKDHNGVKNPQAIYHQVGKEDEEGFETTEIIPIENKEDASRVISREMHKDGRIIHNVLPKRADTVGNPSPASVEPPAPSETPFPQEPSNENFSAECEECGEDIENGKEVSGPYGETFCPICLRAILEVNPHFSAEGVHHDGGRKKLVNAVYETESAFDKLEDEVAEEYEEKGMSDEEADKIGAAVAYKQGVKKYGKKVMTEAAKKGVSAKSLSKEAETCEICAESYALDDEEYCAECSSKHAEYFQTLNAESYTFSKGAEMDGKKLRAGSRDFDDGSMMVGIGTDDIDVEDPDFMEMMIGEDGEIDYFTMPTGLNHYQRMYKPKPTHYGKMKTQNETNETAGGDFYRVDGDGKYAENFSAEFGKPIEDDEEFTTMQVRIGSPSGSTTSWTTSFNIQCVGSEDNLSYLTSDIEDLVVDRVKRWNGDDFDGDQFGDFIPMQIVIGSSSGNSGSWYRQFTVKPVGDEDDLSYLTSDIEGVVVDRVKQWNGDEVIYDAESTALSKPARTAIGLTALGVGIALWKSEWINKLFDRR